MPTFSANHVQQLQQNLVGDEPFEERLKRGIEGLEIRYGSHFFVKVGGVLVGNEDVFGYDSEIQTMQTKALNGESVGRESGMVHAIGCPLLHGSTSIGYLWAYGVEYGGSPQPVLLGDEVLGDFSLLVTIFETHVLHHLLTNRLSVLEEGMYGKGTLGTYAAALSHEIHNPLFYVEGNLEFIHQKLTEAPDVIREDQREDVLSWLGDARYGASYLRTIVNDLRMFTRRGKETELVPVNLVEILDSTVRMVRHQVVDDIELCLNYEEAGQVMGIASRLGQVFLNLMVNAVEALSDKTDGKIEVEAGASSEGRVQIRIRDNGCGISSEELKNIFTIFYSSTEKQNGSGLGLSISQNIIEDLGGTLTAESILGEYTTMIVDLPALG